MIFTPAGDFPYDFLVEDAIGQVRVQVKNQRKKEGPPMMANEAQRSLSAEMYVAETQRTRGGVDLGTGKKTRPYKYGEFDILAVSLQPATGNWNSFMYTVADWLLSNLKSFYTASSFPSAIVPNSQHWFTFLAV